MTVFDRYLAVDWSANNRPKSGRDSIWVAELGNGATAVPSVNPRTRHAAFAHLMEQLTVALDRGERVLLGFDFPFGYPRGAAAALVGGRHWESLWATLASEVRDNEDNVSNRFDVAKSFNSKLGSHGPLFWGCPARWESASLSQRKAGTQYDRIPEFRHVERVARGAKATWQLHYNGSVGSQCLLGIAWLQRLRQDERMGRHVAVWPFETDFERDLSSPIVLAEIYPSLMDKLEAGIAPKDRAQVEAQVRLFQSWDAAGRLERALSFPEGIDEKVRSVAVAEEGWIVGAGYEAAT